MLQMQSLNDISEESTAGTGFDSSDEEREDGTFASTPLDISWIDLGFVGYPTSVAISSLPGCRFKETWRNVQSDIDDLRRNGVVDVFVLCTRGELNKYRVPDLLHRYGEAGMTVYHQPFPDGLTPSLGNLLKMLRDIVHCMESGRRSVIHCFGGLGRACLVGACLLLDLDDNLSSDNAIDRMRELRGQRAVQTVKQYNFIHDFRRMRDEHDDDRSDDSRSLSR